MKKIYLFGAGQIGSRHLQGLKKVGLPLDIKVIDPSSESLKIARKRYDEVPCKNINKISFSTAIEENGEIDIAIISTCSNVRKSVIKTLLKKTKVKNFILEKLLFSEFKDYQEVTELFRKNNCRAWVNCSMRTMPFYKGMVKEFKNKKIQYFVSGSNYGLITNAIHYIDYIAFLTNCYDYEVETKNLVRIPIRSKRKGFLELNGTLNLYFKNGSTGVLTCYPDGNAPVQIEISSNEFRCISREQENKAWISSSKEKWKWKEVDVKIPYQSEMTNGVVENILKRGKCGLVDYNASSKLHLVLLESLQKFMNSNSRQKYNNYPFT